MRHGESDVAGGMRVFLGEKNTGKQLMKAYLQSMCRDKVLKKFEIFIYIFFKFLS